MKHVGRIDLGPSILAHQPGPAHAAPTHRWRAWVPLVAISLAVLVVGLSGEKRNAPEPAIDLSSKRVDVESVPDRASAWKPITPEVVVDKPFAVPQASPGGNVLRIMGPPLVIEVRMPKTTKTSVAKK
jgi:hypothetical protein